MLRLASLSLLLAGAQACDGTCDAPNNCYHGQWAVPCSCAANENACTASAGCWTPPPAPPPAPPVPPVGHIKGFWFGYASSTSQKPAPSSGWFFSFPGLIVDPPFDSDEYGSVPAAPSWGNYEKKILTQGGGFTGWGDSLYSKLKAQISEYKQGGWDGVCWDWEIAQADHTSAGFNELMNATKKAGLMNIVTSTAEGPYSWQAANKDARDIDWSLVDYFVPQMYGKDGKLSDVNWPTYARYWDDGAGNKTITGVTYSAVPIEKLLWGMPVDTCEKAEKFGGSGCVEWAYSPNVRPPMQV